MKTSRIAIVSAAIGVLLGVASHAGQLGWLGARSSLDQLADEIEDPRKPSLEPDREAQPRVAVDGEDYDFGAMEHGSTQTHSFVFSNSGDYPLKLSKGDTTCKCTLSELAKDEIGPGETVDVQLEWTAKTAGTRFRQSAVIFTNDPQRTRVDLTVFGRVTRSLDVQPMKLVFSKLMVGEESTAEVRMLAYNQSDLAVLDHKFKNQESASFYQMATEQIPLEEIDDPDVKSAMRVAVTVRSGLPVGSLDQLLELTTNVSTRSTVNLQILGRIASHISIVGRNWSEERGTLNLGPVESSKGVEWKLNVFVRGENPSDITLETIKTVPELLKVSIGEKTEIKKGSVVKIPLTVGIPKGSRAVNYLGTDQSDLGEIVLQTNHPQAKQLRLLVRFTVEE